MKTALSLIALALLLHLPTVFGKPVPESERIPIDLRRTTLVVADLEASLAFYRDALGMRPIYDNLIKTPGDAASVEEAERALRLVFLQANDDFVGVLGLLQYLKPEKESVNLDGNAFKVGTSVLLFNTSDLEKRFTAASLVPGVKVLGEPSPREYPSYGGEGTIKVMVSVLQDPDGFVVELNQLMSELL